MPAIWAELVLAHFQRLQTRNAAQDFGSVSPAQSATLKSGVSVTTGFSDSRSRELENSISCLINGSADNREVSSDSESELEIEYVEVLLCTVSTLNLKVGTHITAPCPTRESAECWCGLGSVTVRPHKSTAPCPSKFKLYISVTVRARYDHDGLVSVRTCLNLQVVYCAAILSPYDGQQSADTSVGHGAGMCVPAFILFDKMLE
ncbi:hypothetical protein J6590_030877 [Homalodisca vitripennis]|nr:hypothetical protein J6590_030877 [Homalodisca vitripennis]